MRASEQPAQLYGLKTLADNKVQIVRSLFVAGAAEKLLEIAKSEKDLEGKGRGDSQSGGVEIHLGRYAGAAVWNRQRPEDAAGNRAEYRVGK